MGDSDYRLVTVDMILKTPQIMKPARTIRICLDELRKLDVRGEYQMTISGEYAGRTEDDEWKTFKEVLLRTAEETCGTKMIGNRRQKLTMRCTDEVREAVFRKIRPIESE